MNESNESIQVVRGRRRWQIFWLALLGIVLLWTGYQVRAILNPFLLSLILAYVLNPVPSFLERFNINRTVSILCLYLLLSGVILVAGILLLPRLAGEAADLYSSTFLGDEYEDIDGDGGITRSEMTRDIDNDGEVDRSYIDEGLGWVEWKIDQWNESHLDAQIRGEDVRRQIEEGVGNNLEGITSASVDMLIQAVNALFVGIQGIFSLLSYLILVPIYSFFLLRGIGTIRDTMIGYLPERNRDRLIGVLYQIHDAVSSFFRGKLVICLLKGFLTWLCLHLFGIKYAILFAIIQTGASFIPFFVLLVGMAPTLLLITIDPNGTWGQFVAAGCVYIGLEAVEGFILTPWIMGKKTGLHPVTVILAILIGGQVAGFFGLLVAIPVATTIKILGREIALPHLKEVLGHSIDPA